MKNECILLANSNYELAYRLKNLCVKHGIELNLAKNIVELIKNVNQNTKLVLIEDLKENWQNYINYFSKNITYKIYFIENENIFDKNGIQKFSSLEQCFLSDIFAKAPKGFDKKDVALAVEKCFDKMSIIVTCWYGRFVKEVLMYMLTFGKINIKKADLELVAGKSGVNQKSVYYYASRFLKPYYDKVNEFCEKKMQKFDSRVMLTRLCQIAQNEIEKK